MYDSNLGYCSTNLRFDLSGDKVTSKNRRKNKNKANDQYSKQRLTRLFNEFEQEFVLFERYIALNTRLTESNRKKVTTNAYITEAYKFLKNIGDISVMKNYLQFLLERGYINIFVESLCRGNGKGLAIYAKNIPNWFPYIEPEYYDERIIKRCNLKEITDLLTYNGERLNVLIFYGKDIILKEYNGDDTLEIQRKNFLNLGRIVTAKMYKKFEEQCLK